MSIESGSVSCRWFYVPKAMPADVVERFAAQAMPAIETLSDGTIQGWVTGRHLLDRLIDQDSAFFGGHLRLCLARAERKVPEALVRAECAMEERAHCLAQGVDKVSASVRREIRRSILARLTPQAQPQIKGIPFVYDARDGLIVAGALSDSQVDAFQIGVTQALGFSLIPVTPEMAAMKRAQLNVRDLPAVSFSPERADEDAIQDVGLDFLMWLWFSAETSGSLNVSGIGAVSLLVEGPLLFVGEGSGAHAVGLKSGEPMLSRETRAALLDGKKLRRARITLAIGEQAWTATIDATKFVFRGLKLPAEGEKLDAVSRFQERIDQLDSFHRALMGLFDLFIEVRRNADRWGETVEQMRRWIAERRVRA